ncbi:MAG: hypothetical protein H7Z37_04685 [Pyrinomonadaceae bacterium]|nr:hypothetical protein [Pyrinomonadaceae bacterium]
MTSYLIAYLKEYGAMFVARNVTPSPTLIFADEREVSAWQSQIATQNGIFGGVNVKLQTAAMQQLVAARDEARSKGLSLTARGTLAGSRTYAQAVKIIQNQ